MAAFTAIAAGAAVVSTGLSVKAARDSKKQGDRAAEQERLATAEKVRRLRLQAGQIVGAQAAGAAASGVDINSGSIRALQAETVAEFDRQIAFTQTAGAFAAEAAEVAGRSAAFQNLSAGLNSLTSAVRIIDNAGGLRKTFGLG